MAWKPAPITTEDVSQQQAQDNASVEDSGPGGWLGHAADVVSDNFAKGVSGLAGFAGDIITEGVKAVGQASPVLHQAFGDRMGQPHVPGAGTASAIAQGAKQKIVGQDLAPRNRAEKYAGAAIQGAIGAAAGPADGILPVIRTLAVGAAGGAGAEAAHEEFPNSEIAPLAAGFATMLATHKVTSGFGPREAPKAGASTYHEGIDIAMPEGTPVPAPETGTVLRAGHDAKAGNFVVLDHGNGLQTKYMHLSEIGVQEGDTVNAGDVFAHSGATGNVTGPHLHWGATEHGKPVDPRTLSFGEENKGSVGSPVPPMNPEDIASIMNDPEAAGLETMPETATYEAFDNARNEAMKDYQLGNISEDEYLERLAKLPRIDPVIKFPENRIINPETAGPSSDIPFRMTEESGIPNIDDARAARYQRHKEESRQRLQEHDDNYLNDLQSRADNMHEILDNTLDGKATLSPGELADVRSEWEALAARMEQSKLPPLGKSVVQSVLDHFSSFQDDIKKNEGSAPTIPVGNTGYEKHAPYIDEPNTPANENPKGNAETPAAVPTRRTIPQLLKDLWHDESGSLNGDNDNVHDIADARQKKELKDFHATLMSQVRDRAKAAQALAQKVRESGLLPFNIGDRFTTPKGRELKQGPWKVTGHYADPKDPERYGYYVERGREGVDHESSILLVSDPKTDLKYKEQYGMKDWDRSKDVAGWKKQGIVRRLLEDDSGSLNLGGGEEPPKADKNYDGLRPEEKLNQAIRDMRPVSREAAKRLADMKKDQAANLAKLQAQNADVGVQKAALTGQRPDVPDYESIAKHFSPDDVKELQRMVNTNNALPAFSKLDALRALHKLLRPEGVHMPTPRELNLLADVFHDDTIRALIERQRMSKRTLADHVANVGGIPRTIMSSMDISAPARQGLLFIGRKEFWSNYPKMIKMMFNKKYYDQKMAEIRNRPTYYQMRQADLAVRGSPLLGDREEYFISSMAENMPGENLPGVGKAVKGYNRTVGAVVRASDRAYTGFLRSLRADVFDTIIAKGEDSGIHWDAHPEKLKALGRFINTATGRGDLGEFEAAANVASAAFFAPRFIKARLDTLGFSDAGNVLRGKKGYYGTLYAADPLIAKEAAKSLASTSVIAGTMLALAVAGGAKVEGDPRSANSLKIKIGKTYIDLLGGMKQYATFAAREISGQTKTQKGNINSLTSGKYGSQTRLDVAEDFALNKLAPIPGVVRDYMKGKAPAGHKFHLGSELGQMVMPMDLNDVIQSVQVNGAMGAWVAIPAILGFGVETHTPYPHAKKKAKSIDADVSLPSSKADKALRNLDRDL